MKAGGAGVGVFVGVKVSVGVKVRNLGGMSAKQWVRHELDRLGIGREINEFRWGSKTVKLPPSSLPLKK